MNPPPCILEIPGGNSFLLNVLQPQFSLLDTWGRCNFACQSLAGPDWSYWVLPVKCQTLSLLVAMLRVYASVLPILGIPVSVYV